MVVLAEEGIHLQIVAHVVHPAHVPLQVEAQTALLRGIGHHGPGGGLLRHHQRRAVDGKGGAVELPQELDGLQILLAAVLIGPPLLPVIVQIQHGRHRVHPQSVDVVLPQPVGGGGQQEAAHLRLAEVKDPCSPALMLPFQGVAVLIQARAVELDQPVAVLAEVGGHPVQDHADPGPMEPVHQIHEVMGRAVAAGGREITHALIAPAVVQRILRHRQQLHIVIAHIPDIQRQLVSNVAVVQHLAVLCSPPGAQMHLIDVHKALGGVGALPPLPPFLVVPGIAADVVQLAVGRGPGLLMEAVGIGLPYLPAVTLGHHILIGVELSGVFHRQLPCSVRQAAHVPPLPLVEIAAQGHASCLGRPYPEHPAAIAGVCAKIFIGAVPHAAGQLLSVHSRHLLSVIARRPRKKGRYATLFYRMDILLHFRPPVNAIGHCFKRRKHDGPSRTAAPTHQPPTEYL